MIIIKKKRCSNWRGAIDAYGYGRLNLNGKWAMIHRVAWIYENGPVPDGKQLDHLCRNRKCIRLSHLQAVSAELNILRGISPSAINARKTHCIKGHELSGQNIFIRHRPNRPDSRMCLQCSREWAKKSYYTLAGRPVPKVSPKIKYKLKQRDPRSGKILTERV